MHLGIDFGTSLSSAALWRDGRLLLVKEPLRHGYSYPTSVYLLPSGDILVGQAAENQRLNDPGRYRREFKRELGGAIPVTLGDRSFAPEELVAAVLRKLKREAENLTGGAGTLGGAVITVPADYQAHKRGLMERAADAAGFREVTLLEEPVAAALTYTREAGAVAEGAIILVYDLGGGTFDVALLRRTGASYEPIAVPLGLERCGGIDFDRAIYRDVLARFPAIAETVNPRRQDRESQRLRAGLADFCREIKHLLSEADEAELPLPLGFPDESYALSRAAFTALIEPYLGETLALCRQIVGSAGLQLDAVAGVLLVGGSCRMPPIQAAVATLGRPVWRVEEPELAVCQGAALHAALLAGIATAAVPTAQASPPSPTSPPASPTPPQGTGPIDPAQQPIIAPQALELFVSATGPGHCRTIGEALQQARPGATIRVQPGRYAESLTIETPVTLVSADPDAPVLLEGCDAPTLAIRAEGVTVRDFAISCSTSAEAGVPLVSLHAGRTTLENCELRPGPRDGFVASGATCAITLRRCRISESGLRGGTIEGRARATLEECQFAGSAGVGLQVLGAGTTATLRRCQIADGRSDGVQALAGATATLEECVVHNNTGVGVTAEPGGAIALRDCVIQQNHLGLVVADGGVAMQEGTESLLNREGDTQVAPGGELRRELPPPGAASPLPADVPTVAVEQRPTAPPVGARPPRLVATLVDPRLELIATLAFSPDGRWLASGDRKGHLWLWDVERRELARTFSAASLLGLVQPSGVCAAIFDPQGTLLISGHHDTPLRLWDTQTGRQAHQLPGHGATVRAVALGHDGGFLASGGDDRTIRVWWLPTRQPLGALQGHTDAVTSVATNPTTPILASGSKDHTVRLWDLQAGIPKQTLTGHDDVVRAVQFDPTGNTLASGSNDRTVRLWDAANGEPRHTLFAHDDAVYALAYAGPQRLVSGGWDQRLILWDTATARVVHSWSTGPDQWVAAIAASPAAPLLASAGYGGGIKLWEI